MPSAMRWLWVVLWGAAAIVATLWPLPELAREGSDRPLIQLTPYAADWARNMLLFAPLGALLAPWRALPVIGAAAALSLSVEIIQLWLPGRVPSPWDVLANVSGAWLAHAIAVAVRRAGLFDARLHRQAYVAWSGIVLVALLVTPIGFRVALPPPPWFAHWTPDLGHLETYEGNLQAVSLNGEPLPHGLIRSPNVEATMRGEHQLELRGETGVAPSELSALFLITDASGEEIAILGLRGHDVIYRVATVGMRLGLEYPFLWWRDALRPGVVGGPFSVTARRNRHTVCVTIGRHERCDLGPRMQDGWQQWLPARTVDARTRRVLDAAWLVVLFLPLGAGLRARPLQLACLGGVLAALVSAPALGPIAPIGPEAAVTIGLALVAGRLVSAGARRAR